MMLRSSILAVNLVYSISPKILRSTVGAKWGIQMQQRRNLNIHEHMSYTLLREAGIPVPNFGVATTKEEAKEIALKLNTSDLIVKAQVLTGGRGKGKFKGGLRGGVRMVYSPEEVEKIAGKMLGDYLVTKQSGPGGRICNKVMIAERKFPRREYYFAIVMERAFHGPVVIACSQGGVNIEEVAAESPEAILYEKVNMAEGLTVEKAHKIATDVGLGSKKEPIGDMLMKLYKLFVEKDAVLFEINPFAEEQGEYYALDAKLRFDENAAFRQKELFTLRDWSQEDPKEVEAAKFDLNYIALDGNIACMVNGAGLAMATMDIISLYGGSPANFLDVGGGATTANVKEAFKIIMSDPNVLVIMVNIFGGIMRCDVIASGIISAAKDLKMTIPIICRLHGTNMDDAKVLIANSGMKILPVDSLDEAARLAVKLSKIVTMARAVHIDVKFELPV